MNRRALLLTFSMGVLTFITTGCMQQYKAARYTAISGLPSNPIGNTEYFVNGKCPEKDYIPIASLEVYKRGAFADHALMRHQLLQQGASTGADALLINELETWTTNEVKASLLDVVLAVSTGTDVTESEYTTHHNLITGQAVIYADNISHLTDYIRQEKLHLYIDSLKDMAPVATVDYGFAPDDFTINSTNQTVISSYMQYNWEYSLRRLLHQADDRWRFKQRNGQVVRRKFSNNNFISHTTYAFNYDQYKRVKQVNITKTLPGGGFKPEKLIFIYDEAGFLTEKLLQRSAETIREIFIYNNQGQLTTKNYFRATKGKSQRMFMQSVYTYYTEDYAQQFIVTVNDTPPVAGAGS